MDMELRQMEIRNYMNEQVLPLWESESGDVGVQDENGLFHVSAGLVSSLIMSIADDIIEHGHDDVGAMEVLDMIMELIFAAHTRVMPVTVPDDFDE